MSIRRPIPSARSINTPAVSKVIPSWRIEMRRAACLLACCLTGGGIHAAEGTVSPAGDTVPVNLLRIELTFDRLFEAPLDMRHVHLYDEHGEEIRDAFLDQPLPAADGHGVTILMHPGRIKSGVGPAMALGPALSAGSNVRLVISAPNLRQPLVKRWRVTAAEHERLAPARWKLDLPQAGSTTPLSIRLPSTMNTGAAQMIAIGTTDGGRLPGKSGFVPNSDVWRFTPAKAWRAGAYVLRVHPDIEDAAGNRLCAAFEEAHQSRLRCDDEAQIDFLIDKRHADSGPPRSARLRARP
jgi:hypothetical protein